MKILTLTEASRKHIESLLAEKSQEAGLRIDIKKGGCAGMEYALEIVDEPFKGDDIIREGDASIYVAPSAVLFLLGTQLDYEVTKLRSGFVFNNPNQVSACGCGESIELIPAQKPAS